MKFKRSMFLSAIVLGSGCLLTVPAMADYHCFGNNLSVIVSGFGWDASYEGHAKAGKIYIGSNKVSDYQRGSHINWKNGGYRYKVLIYRDGEPYRVQVYKPNGKRIVNKKLSCRWQD